MKKQIYGTPILKSGYRLHICSMLPSYDHFENSPIPEGCYSKMLELKTTVNVLSVMPVVFFQVITLVMLLELVPHLILFKTYTYLGYGNPEML